MINYEELIREVRVSGGLLDAALACQNAEGFLSDAAIEALAASFQSSVAEIYDSVSFYSMIRFNTKGKVRIEICRGAPCHVAGSEAVIAEIEKVIGVTIGETSEDGKYSFDWIECQGQCQSAPTILVNDKIYTDMTPEKVRKLLEGGLKAC